MGTDQKEASSSQEQVQDKQQDVPNANASALAEDQLRLLIESAKDYAIFTLDADRKVTSWSSGAEIILGYTEAEIIGQSGDILFVPEDREKKAPEQEAKTAVESGSAENERWHLRKDGSRFWGSGMTHPLRNEEGRAIGFVKIMRDLTTAKRLEDAKFFLASIVETSNDSIITIDFQRTITSWNKAAEDLYGYTAQEAIGKNLTMLTLPKDFEELLANVDAVQHSRQVVVFDTVRHKKNGQAIDLEIVMSPVLNATGEVIGVSTIARDVSERKRREANLAFLAKINLGFAPLLSIQEVMEPVASQLADYLHLNRCHFSLIDEESDRVELIYEYRQDESLPTIKPLQHVSDKFTEEGRQHLSDGQLVVMNEIPDNGLVNGGASGLKRLGFGSLVYIPHLEAGRWRFLLTAGRAEESEWRRDELVLLQELASKLYIRIERAKAEEALRKSEEKYRSLFETIDEGVATVEVLFGGEQKAVDYRILEVNRSHEALIGVGPTALGKRIREVMPTIEDTIIERVGEVVLTGQPVRYEDYVSTLGRWFDIYLSRVGGQGSYTAISVFHDITERKKAEERQLFLLNLTDALRPLLKAEEAQFTAVVMLGKHLGVSRAFYCEMEADGDHLVIRHNYLNGVESLEGQFRMSDFGPFLLTEQLAGRTVAMRDAETDERLTEKERVLYRGVNVRAFVCVPLVKGGKIFSVLAVNQPTPRKWTEAEIEMIRETADRTWAAVERARAEEALQNSEERLQLITDLVPDLLWESDHNGSTNWYNQRWLEYTGQSFEEAIGWGWLNAIHPDDREASERKYHKALNNGEVLRQEHRIRRHDGKYRWFVVNAIPLKDESGQVVKMYGAATDIHELRLMNEALLESEERLRTLSDAVPQVIWTNTGDGIADYFNQRWYDFTGLGYEQSKGPGWQAVVHPDDALVSVQKWQEALASGNVFETEYRLRRHDGSYCWFIGRNVPLKDASGKVAGWFGSATEIESLKKSEEALSQSEARLKITMESATDYAIITMDAERRVEKWSQGAVQLFSYTEEEMIGKSADIIFTEEDRAVGAPQKEMETARDQGRAPDERWHQRKDGSRFYASGVLRPIQNNGLTGYVKVLRDMTQQRLFTEELHRLVAERTLELQRSNEDLQRFASIASHDLQEPLRKLKLFASVLQKFKTELPEEGKELLQKIHVTSERMSQLIREVLLFSKIAYGVKEFAPTDLHQILENVLSDLDILLKETDTAIEYEDNLPQIEAAPSQINQLFYNLLTNAVKFRSEERKPIIHISVRPFSKGEIKNPSSFATGKKLYRNCGIRQWYWI